MMYNLLLTGEEIPSRVASVLSEAFGVRPADVDVSAMDEYEARNWDAVVSCEYEELRGDLRWSLTIYATEEAALQPTEEGLALLLSQALGTVTLFPEGMTVPSIRRVATPRGELSHARVTEPESEGEETRVTAVEIEIPEFPHASVSMFPEIIKEIRHDTPVVDAYFPTEAEGDLKALRGDLINWERLTVRMTAGWPPSRWYPAAMYLEDLRFRDEAEEIASHLPDVHRGPALRALEELDAIYRHMTVEDGGRALSEACELPIEEFAGRPWYWLRRPPQVPWQAE
jgi:hypothetical protein